MDEHGWESAFASWASPPGKTEQDRCDNAVSAVRNAVAASGELNRRSVRVFVHGSYRNNVNVKQDSDVDLGVLCDDSFFYVLPDGHDAEAFGIRPATYHYSQFKDELQRALAKHFGARSVTPGSKVFHLHETSYHVKADVAAFFEHQRFDAGGHVLKGVELRSIDGSRIINWPEQHYDNGVSKNDSTSRAYKGAVRIFKRLMLEMQDHKIAIAVPLSGFVLECMVWHVPDPMFRQERWVSVIRDSIVYLWSATKTEDKCAEWGEVSDLKYLFKFDPQRRVAAHAFLEQAWAYIGFQ
ncbi:MAG: nucleotidyltransferase [Gemmatimonadales bacterium]